MVCRSGKGWGKERDAAVRGGGEFKVQTLPFWFAFESREFYIKLPWRRKGERREREGVVVVVYLAEREKKEEVKRSRKREERRAVMVTSNQCSFFFFSFFGLDSRVMQVI